MKMRESEIFNNYIRLATDAGLISEDELTKTADPNDKPRYDRYSFSDLEALYRHKFEPNKGEGESIVDVAHPETMVVGPAYDAINAVVENLHQRQDIMTYVALKQPDGHLVQRRYVKASENLIKSLVSVGFSMDSINETDLMSLADSCAGSIQKQALAPLAVGALALVGVLGYAMYGATSVQTVSANSQMVLERAGELSGKPYVNSIRAEVSVLKELADMFYQAKDAVIANSIDDVVSQAATDKAKAMTDLVEKYKAQQNKVIQKIPEWKAAVNSSIESGSREMTSDTWQKLTSMFGAVVPDKWISYFQNAGSADEKMLLEELDALGGAIQESQQIIGSVAQMARKYEAPIQQAVKAQEEKKHQEYDMFKDKEPTQENINSELEKEVMKAYNFG